MENNKIRGIISYLFGWIGGLIVLLAFKDNDKKTTIHAAQSITASVAVFVLSFALGFIEGLFGIHIPLVGTVLYALQIVVLVMGIVKVVNNDAPELPVVGDIAKSIFAKRINAAPETVDEPKKEEPKKEEKPEEPKNE